jgi:hypothetical protein
MNVVKVEDGEGVVVAAAAASDAAASAALLSESLDFSLEESLETLTTVQLCLVQFHPEADEATKNRAELIYWRRSILHFHLNA